jgi:uncharacterized repeat protein (TIGR01451 family)
MKTPLKNLLLPVLVTWLALARGASANAASADLSLTASAAPEPVGVGSNLVYSVTVSNAGPSVATAVVISNQLPASLDFDSANGFYSLSNSVLLVNFASLAVGATNSARVVVQPMAAGKLTSLFQVFADQPDPALTNNSATVVSTVTNGMVVPIPGTPTTGWNNPGGQTVFISEGGGIGAQPLTNGSGPLPVTSGSVVLLIDPNGGTNISNWKAVVDFYNPNDPTGAQGLVATNYITFFQSNAGPGYFAYTVLMSNVAYVPIATTNADGSVTAHIDVFGPVGGILAGQEAVITLTAAVQPSVGPPSVTIASPTAGQVFGNLQGFAVSGTWSRSQSSEAPISNIWVQLNGGSRVSAVFFATAFYPFSYLYTVAPLVPSPGSNTVQAEIVDVLGNASTNTVTFDYEPFTGGTNTLGIPGTPSTVWISPGKETVTIPIGGGIGVQNVLYFGSDITVLAGDVVMLINTNNGHSASNWKAVVKFFNPDDPTGTNGLAAMAYQTFFFTNASPDYFANFQLMPNVVYAPIATTNADGSITASINVFGPVGGIVSGQLGVLNVTASIQPNAFALTITSPATGLEVVSDAVITVTGTTSNSLAAVSNVWVQLNGGGWTSATTANGWTNWSEQVALTPGLNTLQVYAVDILGNVTPTNSVALAYAADASSVADVSLSGRAGPQSGTSGTNLVYFLTVSNAGPSAATGVTVSDQLPAGVAFISATGGAAPTNGLLLVNLGSLAVGATNSLQIAVQPTNGFNALTNVFQVVANQFDPDLTNNSATIVVADLEYTTSTAEYYTEHMTNVNQQVNEYATEIVAQMPGGPVLFDQTFNAPYSDPTVQAAVAQAAGLLTGAGAASYTGPTEASNSRILIGSSWVTVPNSTNFNFVVGTKEWIGPATLLVGSFGAVQGYTYDPVITNYAIPAGWNGNPGTLNLPPGFVDYNAMVLTLADIYQTTTITSNYLNSSVYEMTGVVAQADLSLSASAAPEPVTVGSNLVYSISITNHGPAAATGVVLSNQIPANVAFISATGGATPTNGVLLVDLGSLAVGATNSIQIVVQPTAAGKITNLFQVFANQAGPALTNNFATVVSTVTYLPVLPSLTIAHPGNSAVVSWPNSGSYTLQQNSNLATATWTTSGYPITTASGTNRITITPPVGNLFFRLEQ